MSGSSHVVFGRWWKDLTGILGTRASLSSDLSLLLQIVTTLLITIGFFYERRRGKHCVVMGAAVTTNIIFVLAYMVTRLLREQVPDPPPQFAALYDGVVVPHGVLSIVVLVLAVSQAVLAYRWRTKQNEIIVLGRRKHLHRRLGLASLILWYISMLSGLTIYAVLYIM